MLSKLIFSLTVILGAVLLFAGPSLAQENADAWGSVVISEIMSDAGAAGNSVQWIELYNSSITKVVNLKGWKLDIRNLDVDAESYVDSGTTLQTHYILPNQTALLVSDHSSVNDVPDNRIYNLYQRHRVALGLLAGKSVLLNSEGFYLSLTDKNDHEVDEVGNIVLDGPQRRVVWALPETGGKTRTSILRQFGTGDRDGASDAADDGTLRASWLPAESMSSYYGHRDDIGSPGHPEGGPLTVSLSSFRPVHNPSTGHIDITWVTESELNTAGFNILRSESQTGAFKVINLKGPIPGHGTTSGQQVYKYRDTTAKPNVAYYYQIQNVSIDGKRTRLRTTHLRGNISPVNKLTTTWGDWKTQY